MHYMTLEKHEGNPKASRQQETIKAEGDEMGAERTVNKIHQRKIRFFIIKLTRLQLPSQAN